jgi:hypothetical protein
MLGDIFRRGLAEAASFAQPQRNNLARRAIAPLA